MVEFAAAAQHKGAQSQILELVPVTILRHLGKVGHKAHVSRGSCVESWAPCARVAPIAAMHSGSCHSCCASAEGGDRGGPC